MGVYESTYNWRPPRGLKNRILAMKDRDISWELRCPCLKMGIWPQMLSIECGKRAENHRDWGKTHLQTDTEVQIKWMLPLT